MQLDKFLNDATGLGEADSQRAKYVELTKRLNAAYSDVQITMPGVAKWFARKSIPMKWAMRICCLRKPTLNLSNYA